MNPFSLEGKTILVTGATSGIGYATCLKVAAMDGMVIALGRNQERLGMLKQAIGTEHEFHTIDLTDETARLAFAKELVPVDGVIHSAGISKLAPIRFISEKDYDDIMNLNLKVPVLFTQELLKKRKIKEKASIVMLSSIINNLGISGHLVYAGSKGGLLSVAKVMAMELAKQEIRVNCLSPGLVETPILDVYTSEELTVEREKYPLGLGKPEDIANACIFLLSDASRWITGSNIVIDGGLTLR